MHAIHLKVVYLFVALTMTAWNAGTAENTPPGSAARLRVTGTGELLLDGKPFRGFGVNYFDAFSRRLHNPEDHSSREGFAALARYNIPFVRFMCGGFYASEWRYCLNNREACFAALDEVVDSAHKNGVGLIPSLFWWYPGVPDLVGEPMDQLGNPDSNTHAFIREYTEDVVRRYGNHPAIWAWEFGNEYNLASDLPNAMDHLPPVIPGKGTPGKRTARDTVTTAMVMEAMRTFADTVRRLDPYRPVTTGHALPRPSQYHQRIEGSWTIDTVEEYQRELLRAHPAPYDLVSVHIYPNRKARYFDMETCSWEKHMSILKEAARTAGKAVFIGEFGSGNLEKEEGVETARKEFESLLAAIEISGIALAALWVYDFSWQDDSCNVTPSNQRAWQLEALREVNARMKVSGTCPP